MKQSTNLLLIIPILALFIRLLFIFHPGFLADIAYWKWWSSASAEKGLIHTINYVNYNYPSFYLYILKLTGHVYLLFAPTNSPDFYNTYNPLFLFLIKLPYIFADLGIGVLIFLIIKNLDLNKNLKLKIKNYYLASALYLFNPVTIYNSAIWGQTDSLGTFFALMAIYLAFQSRIVLCSIILSLAFFLKVQTNILIFFTFVYIFIRFGLSNVIKSIGVMSLTSLLLNTPYLISHTFDKVVNTILTSFNYFPFISLNAYNLQWLMSPPGRPDQIPDTTILLGSLTYKNFGLILFAITLLIGFLNILKSKNYQLPIINYQLINSSALAVFAFFVLPTQMHERYIFPLFAFLPILVIYHSYHNYNRYKIYWFLIYIILSITILLNLHLVMLLNYPQTSLLPLLPQRYDPSQADLISFINVIIFILFLIPFLRPLPKKLIAIPIILILISNFKFQISNSNFTLLTSLTPVKSTQSFSTLTKNKNLFGNRLSSSWIHYESGLATHANSEIVYALNSNYKTFITDMGVDTGAHDSASVEFKILLDSKEVYKSGLVKKWDFPKSVKLDVSGASALTLIVTDGGDSITNDHADWLNAKLIK